MLVTPDHIAGNELTRTGDLAPANVRLQQPASGSSAVRSCAEVRAGEVEVEDRFSGERVEPAGRRASSTAGTACPTTRLARRPGRSHRRAGDAVAPRTIYEAVLEGRRAALDL